MSGFLCISLYITFFAGLVCSHIQGDQKYAGKMRDQFLKMRHKMRAYLIQLLNKIFFVKVTPTFLLHFYYQIFLPKCAKIAQCATFWAHWLQTFEWFYNVISSFFSSIIFRHISNCSLTNVTSHWISKKKIKDTF